MLNRQPRVIAPVVTRADGLGPTVSARHGHGRLLPVLGLACLLSAGALPARGQTNTGELGGVVRDESGAVLPGATVVATHVETGFAVERFTDADGRFFMPSLPIGAWEIAAELPGFRRVVRTGVMLDIGRTLDLPFELELGTLSRRSHRYRRRAAAADDQRRDQRHHHQRRGRADSAERTAVPATRAAQRRRRDPARRHARRGAAAGRSAAQHRRPARRPQHLPARRRQGDRRAVQQPGHQPVGRFDPRVQDPEVHVSAGVRRQGVGADKRGDQGGHEPLPRQRVRLRSGRAVRRSQLLRPARRAGAAT